MDADVNVGVGVDVGVGMGCGCVGCVNREKMISTPTPRVVFGRASTRHF